MSTVNIYASELISVGSTDELDVVDGDCLSPLQALLPPGAAWNRDDDSNLTALLLALSYEFCRIKRRGRNLLDEIDPRTTLELLEDLERVYGLPSPCVTPTTLEGRRAALHGKMLGFGSPTEAFFLGVAQGLGYADATITTYGHESWFTCISPCTDALYSPAWTFTWTLSATSLGTEQDDVLRCTIEGLNPDHLQVFFDLT